MSVSRRRIDYVAPAEYSTDDEQRFRSYVDQELSSIADNLDRIVNGGSSSATTSRLRTSFILGQPNITVYIGIYTIRLP